MHWGEPLEGFKSTLSPLKDKSGTVVLTIGWQGQADSDWGISSDEETSDQIRLSLVRETNPERPFGELVYDFTKTWTNSSDIEVSEEDTKTEDAIELAEGETAESNKPAILKPILPIKPGTVLKPSQVITDKPSASSLATAQDNTTSNGTNAPKVFPMKPIVKKLEKPNTIYDLYKNANLATWKSSAGDINFPGSPEDRQGFVRTIPTGKICPDNKANKLLETHPQWIDGGTIEGRYPMMVLGNNFKFKATGAMLKGAANSDGVIMTVGILYKNKIHRVMRKRIDCKSYEDLEVDLSSWAGKVIQIVLQVRTGKTSKQDWAVWVYPRLTNQ